VKKSAYSAYSAAAVTVLGTGNGLAQGGTTQEVDDITQYSVSEIVIHTQEHPYDAAEKLGVESDPSTSVYTDYAKAGSASSAPNWLPTPYTPDQGYPTKKNVCASFYHISNIWTTIPAPLKVAYREKLDAGGQGTGIYEAYIAALKVQKQENWGSEVPGP